MEDIIKTKKACSFYVSNMHFATMILPFANKKIEDKTKIITFLENNFNTNIELVLSRLTIEEERKKEILNIKWKNTKLSKFTNIEKTLKNELLKNEKCLIIVNGGEEYINLLNMAIDKVLEKNNKKFVNKEIKIINFYEVTIFNENITEILEKHEKIFNTSGEHEISEIFEGYGKKLNVQNI